MHITGQRKPHCRQVIDHRGNEVMVVREVKEGI